MLPLLVSRTIIGGESSVVKGFHLSHTTVIRYTNALYHFLL